MNPSFDFITRPGFALDVLGLLGLSLVALSAVRLAWRDRSWGSGMIACGATLLLLARVYLIASPHLVNDDVLLAIGPVGIALTIALPPLFLTFGLAGIVWGLWAHHRWLQAAPLR